MARPKKPTSKKVSKTKVTESRVSKSSSFGPFEKIQNDLSLNQSSFSLILGILIVVVLGILIFNYFNKSGSVGPSDQTQITDQNGDVRKEALPGKYTVKDGDTLFTLAQKYYNDGSKFTEIMKANNLSDENVITTGQVLDIPKLESSSPVASAPTQSASPSESPSVSPSPSDSPASSPADMTQPVEGGTGGAPNQTAWGEKISGDTYTVVEGDWLSKIAGRAYGDIFQYQKLAQANNISNPDLIEPGTVLRIPR